MQKQIAHFTVNQEGEIWKAKNDLLSHEAPKGNCRVSTGEVAICLRRRRTSRELLFRVGKLSLKQVQFGQSKLDSSLGTDNQKEYDFIYSLHVQIKGSQNILNIKSQSAFEGGAPAESCYLALLRVGKLSLKQVQLGQSKLDSPLGTDNQKEYDFFIHNAFR